MKMRNDLTEETLKIGVRAQQNKEGGRIPQNTHSLSPNVAITAQVGSETSSEVPPCHLMPIILSRRFSHRHPSTTIPLPDEQGDLLK